MKGKCVDQSIHGIQEVVGSIPISSTRKSNRKLTTCDNRILTTPKRFIIPDNEG